MSWGKGIKLSMGLTLVSVLVFIVYYIVFVKVIEPNYFENVLEFKTQKLYESRLTEEQVEKLVSQMKSLNNIGMSIAMILLAGLFFGLIISAITSAIMKKNPKQIEEF